MDLIQFNNNIPNKVFPFPGGPNNNKPLQGALIPVNKSGRSDGQITISYKLCFAKSCPTI